MDQINLSPSGTSVKTAGQLDYVQNGTLYLNGSIRCIMVSSGDDLAGLTDVTPGSIAHTAGYTAMWQLSADGEWVPVFDFSGSSDAADDSASDDQTEGG